MWFPLSVMSRLLVFSLFFREPLALTHLSVLLPCMSWTSLFCPSQFCLGCGGERSHDPSPAMRYHLLSPSYLWHQLWAHFFSLSARCYQILWTVAFFLGPYHAVHSLFSISGSCFVSTSEILNTSVFLQHFVLVAHFAQRTSLPGNCIHAFPEAVLRYYVQGQVSSAGRLWDSVWPLEYWFISLYGHFMKGISQFLMSKWWVVDNTAQRWTTCLPEWHPEFNLPHFQTKQH